LTKKVVGVFVASFFVRRPTSSTIGGSQMLGGVQKTTDFFR
jgi:hypothetical protein